MWLSVREKTLNRARQVGEHKLLVMLADEWGVSVTKLPPMHPPLVPHARCLTAW